MSYVWFPGMAMLYTGCDKRIGTEHYLKKDDPNMYGTKLEADTDLTDKYIVVDPASTLPPTMFYNSRPEAIKVATLMAHRNLGRQFGVFKCVGSAKTAKVQYDSYSD